MCVVRPRPWVWVAGLHEALQKQKVSQFFTAFISVKRAMGARVSGALLAKKQSRAAACARGAVDFSVE